MSSGSRQSCLLILSSAIEGVSAQSFIQSFTLAQTAFNVQLASPNGKVVEYIHQDDNSRRWLSDFRVKSYSTPISFEAVEASRYGAILIPHSPGAVHDLAHNAELGNILQPFIQEKKPVCAVGMGVAGLFSAKLGEDNTWSLKAFSMTATSVYELCRTPYFGSLTLIPEDHIKDQGAKYSCSEPDAVHIVVDRQLVTGQNEQSTLIAVQNLILLCNQRSGKVSNKS